MNLEWNELDNDGSSSASASILSMPDPLSSSSVQVVPPQLPLPHDSDHSDHEFESDSDSESSFPSVTSSFFFSSPASVASEGTGSGAARELTIPPLTLPEALASSVALLSLGHPTCFELWCKHSARHERHRNCTIRQSFIPLVPLIHLNYDRAPSSILSSQNAPLAALDVSSVQELHNALTHQPEASQRLRTEAVEKYLNVRLYGSDITALDSSHIKDDSTVVLGIDLPSASGSTVEPEGTWTQFKAQWEASLEEAYSSSRDMKLMRRQVDSTPESEEDALFASRVPHTVAHAAVHGTGTVKARKPSRTKKSTTRNSSSTSSSSLSRTPSTPLIPPVPLVVAFPSRPLLPPIVHHGVPLPVLVPKVNTRLNITLFVFPFQHFSVVHTGLAYSYTVAPFTPPFKSYHIVVFHFRAACSDTSAAMGSDFAETAFDVAQGSKDH
ncbi:hypothetical protein BDP27DRAFT_1417536 [Rhodocollybia butyracea]|uniref:Uncharacterized protein n=1 Tax=Rhodocollybia butyracea TaxID=206335 RepID=A0A9P5Q2V0_9AGAR|nr:hypothetical protein BDP27DRAFT_1417536 [Rhodocollybia butyracea]